MSEPFDSRPETWAHIDRVRALLSQCAVNLGGRGDVHDRSKLEEPELSGFNAVSGKLKTMAYGTPEYKAALAELGPALRHHYDANTHHPEHFPNGIAGMSLFDVLEMLMDWKAATERMKDGGNVHASLEHNIGRFKIEPQLASILANTIVEMGWPDPRL